MLAALGLYLDLLALVEQLSGDLAQAHPALDHGHVASELQLHLHLGRHLLLAVSHLDQGVLEGLALDLPGQHHQLLDARCQERRFREHLAFRPLYLRLLGFLAEGISALVNVADQHLAFPANATPRVRVDAAVHVRGQTQLVGSRGSTRARGRSLGLGGIDLVGEDGRAVETGRLEAVHELPALLLGPRELLGELDLLGVLLLLTPE